MKSNMEKEVGVDDVTIANCFEILKNTMLGFILPGYDKSVRKAQRTASKFYFIVQELNEPSIKHCL